MTTSDDTPRRAGRDAARGGGRIYVTHCSGEKDDSLEGTGRAVAPDELYTSERFVRFVRACREGCPHSERLELSRHVPGDELHGLGGQIVDVELLVRAEALDGHESERSRHQARQGDQRDEEANTQ